MAWSKAKNILIVLLIFLNIFLLFSIAINNKNTVSNQIKKSTQVILDQRQIKLNTKTPDFSGKIGMLIYSDYQYNLNKISDTIMNKEWEKTVIADTIVKNNNETLEVMDSVLKYTTLKPNYRIETKNNKIMQNNLKRIIKSFGINKKFYTYSQTNENERIEISFVELYNNSIVVNNYVTFIIEKGFIKEVEMSLKNIKRETAPKEIVSAYQILIANNFEIGTVIDDIILEYIPFNKEELYDSPVWRFCLSDGSIILFDAYTGQKVLLEE